MKRKPIMAKWVLLAGMCALFMFASADAAQAIVRYVDGSRPSSGTGLSWAEAFKTIQEAVDAAAANDEIWIKQGTYSLTSEISITKALSLYGGFQGNETARDQRDWNIYATIIDGNSSTRCFSLSAVSAAVTLDGFTIQNGLVTGKGGAVYASGMTTKTIVNCRMLNNSATAEGGAICAASGTNINVQYSTFTGNTATLSGGAIYSPSASGITSCRFSNNQSLSSSGGAIDAAHNTIKNSIFYQNTAQLSGGAVNGPNTIVNCTLFNNIAIQIIGGGNCIAGSTHQGSLYVTNCIVWRTNSSTNPEISASPNPPLVSYSIVTGGFTGTGNLSDAPQFVDAPNGNLHLAAGSPGIDDGNNSDPAIPQFDLDGEIRIQDGDIDGTATIDIGAFEFQPIVLSSPNGGESLLWGTGPLAIQWIPGDAGALVKIEISRDSGMNWVSVVDSTANNGRYDWNAIPPASRLCRIRVSSLEHPSIYDVSNADFTLDLDADFDGMSDLWELDQFGSLDRDGTGDWDADGLSDLGEYQNQTNPKSKDTDGDGMPDKYEVDHKAAGLNPLVNDSYADADSDGFCNIREYLAGTNPGDPSSVPAQSVIHVDVANTTGVEDGTSLHPFNTISEAVALASSSVTEEIWVRKGTYSLSSPITISKKVNLYGGFDGTEQSLGERDWANKVTTIDGQSTAGCFTVTSDVTFDGLRINNCKPGITVPSSVTTAIHPVIANCSFTGNSALEGGALSINSHPALMQVTNTRFENNTATDRGGAIYNYGADINILQCEFVNNRVLPDGNIKKGGGAIFNDGSYWVPTCNITGSSFNSNYSGPQGGAIINYKATGVIYNCSFWGNEAPSVWGGGAIYNRLSIFTIDFCEFTSNTTGSGGGAINNEDSPSVIQNCTFVNNHAGYYGGAIRNYNPQSFDSPKILNCIFLGNSTDGEGGAISNGASPPNITNCTFSNNSSTNLGGAIYSNGHTADNKHPKITNCILWNNTAPTNPEIGNSDSTPSVTYCDVQGGYSGTGNKNIDPKFDPNLRLLDGSPCLDAGSNSAPDILATDMDGIPRVIDYDRNGAAVVDMGAYEHAALRYQPHSGTINTETWGSGTHYVTASVTVADNQMLTIEPCAVIKFAPNTQLLVYGTLRASGTSVCPIVFTSRDDDSHGETIVDSDGTPAAGDWYGIYLNGNSNYEGIGEFDYCIIRYGGNASGSADANVHFYYSDSGHMTNSTSEHSAQHGVRISTCSPQITGSQLSSNGNSGLYVSGAGSPTITGNNFTGNSQYGAELNLTSVNPVIYGNTGSGNLLSNGLVVSGTVGSNQTWSSTPLLPIVLQSSVSVSNNVRLTIEPGTIVKFGSGGQLYVYGALDANGAKDNPVVFTSLKDDTYGGDTNGDGTASAPAAGDWYGIYLNGSSTYQGIGEFDFCIFRYGGNAGGSADANVYFYYSDSGHMTDCTIEHSVQHGVRISTCSPLITKSTFQNNVLSGLYASGAGSPTISGNIFISNDQYGAYMNLTSVSPVISGNTGTGNQTNAFVFEGTVNVNQTWSSGPGFPIVLLSAVTVSNNIRLTIEPGTVVKFAPGYQFLVYGTLDAHGTDGNWVVFTSLKDDTYGGDTNSDGAATAPAPGDWYGIYLNGNSSNQGIGEFDYCLFRYGGNPTGSADANVYFYYSDSGYMINCISEHSVQQGVRISNCSPLIANSTITKNTLYGLSVATGSPRIINGIVWSNTAGGISGGTPVVLYSDVQGGFTGEGNINADPLFLDIAKGDYRLDDCSPAADSGDPVETLTADYSAGALVVTVDQVTAVQPGSTVWITDGVNLENGVVASTTANTITVTNGFANSYTLAKKSYLFTSTSDYYGEPDPNGQHIDMGAYGGTSEAVSPLSCRADLAGTDQDVDGSDLRALITAFGDYNPAADFNNDGIVNGIDLAVFAEQFGRTDCAVCP